MWEQLGALKPPFWLISLPLFIVLYRNTATSPQGEDKRVDDKGNVDGAGEHGGGDKKQDEGNAKDEREYDKGKQILTSSSLLWFSWYSKKT